MDEYNPSSRVTANDARGRKRRLGNSKRSSEEPSISGKCSKRKDQDVGELPSNSIMPVLPGTSSFFHSQKVGFKGIRVKLKEAELTREQLEISRKQYELFLDLSQVCDTNISFIKRNYYEQEKHMHSVAWHLLSDENVLLYGVGSKSYIIKGLVQNFLIGEDVIEIGESTRQLMALTGEYQVIKSLLSYISRNILKYSFQDSSNVSLVNQTHLLADLLNIHYGRGNMYRNNSSKRTQPVLSNVTAAPPQHRAVRMRVDDSERWGGRYAQAQPRLYLIIHDICGKGLNDPISQQCLGVLAKCPSVSILATLVNLNSVLRWTPIALAQYRWTYMHTPTFQTSEVCKGASALVVEEKKGHDSSLEAANEDGEDGGEDETGVPTSLATSSAVPVAAEELPIPTKAPARKGKSSSSTSIAAATAANSADLATSSINAINKSLMPKHVEFMTALLDAVRKKTRLLRDKVAANPSNRTLPAICSSTGMAADYVSHWNGVSTRELLEKLRGGLVVKTMKELEGVMKEYFDHDVIVRVPHQGHEYICFKPQHHRNVNRNVSFN